jgi:hypothetical protein
MLVPSGLSVDVNLLEYENAPVKLVALRKTPKIETPGITIEEVDERKEFSVPFWIAGILVESGLAKWGEEGLTSEEWTSTHFKERFNPGGPPGALPKDFYAKAYISLRLAARAAEGDAAKTEQINRLHARFREIVESRVGKVTRIATTESSPQPGVLQPEEERFYEELEHIISAWRRDIRRLSTR